MALSDCELPTIDFSEEAMKPGTTTWDLTCKHVVKALEEYGCFMATFSEINHELYTEMFSSVEKLFNLPKETKLKFASDNRFYGYVPESPLTPLLQSMQLPDALRFETIQNLALRMWPEGDAALCETIHSYVTRVSELEKTVIKMIFQNYGVKKHFEEEFKSMNYALRLMKYGAPMTDETTGGAGNHHDTNLITILQADGDGLQMPGKNGEWINATPSSSSLMVIIGESFHGWSNGRLKCPLHRVKMSGFKSRHSVGLFLGNRSKMEIPSELVDEQHPLLFKPFDLAGIMQGFMQRIVDKSYTGDDDNMVPIVATHFSV